MILDVKNIAFSYDSNNSNNKNKNNGDNKSNRIFENISFSIEKGDVLCILGPNGTGKTTLLKCLNGIYNPNQGDILINEKKIDKFSFNEISKIIGYIPQGHVSTFPFSVLDVVLMGRAPYISLMESPNKKDLKIAKKALKTLGIANMKDKEYTNLSGGERQLVFLARVLAQEPELLILDEPTSHLDFGNQIRLLEIIDQLAKSGLAIIMSSHFPDHAFSTSNKVAIMKDGNFIDFGNPVDVITADNLKIAYNIDIEIIESKNKQKFCMPIKPNIPLKF